MKLKKVMVTGSDSMIGRAICDNLITKAEFIDRVRHPECDLLDIDQVRSRFTQSRPDYVVHAAGYNGGIEWNRKYPADIFHQTIQMGLNVLKMCCDFKVKKVLSIISSCAYPDLDDEALQEDSFWSGLCNPSVECHGLAKRFLNGYSRQISKQFGIEAVTVVLNNSYGPWDSYDPHKTKVVGAMIKRFVDAKEQSLPCVECWGSGAPLREFVYSQDAGKLIALSLQEYSDTLVPLNLSTGVEVSIKQLAETTAKVVGYEGEIKWDTSKPDGQLRKKLDTSRMFSSLFGEGPFPTWTSLEDGLKQTVKWYYEHRK